MNYANSLTALIGMTPLIRLNSLSGCANLFAKCEFMNPYSIKDRLVLSILTGAEKRGEIRRGDTIIEATSGNTGIALAAVAAARGYRVILVMSAIQSLERRRTMKALGAQIVLTPAGEGTAGARKEMFRIREEHPEYYYLGQHVNPDNPLAHYTTTGPEIWRQLEGNVDVFLAGLGTGGTISGTGRFLKERSETVKVFGFEPDVAPFIAQGVWHPHHLMGIAPGFKPETLDPSVIDGFLTVSEREPFAMCRQVAASEGILLGITGGAALHCLVELSRRPEFRGKNLVTVLPDSGERYLSVEGLFD